MDQRNKFERDGESILGLYAGTVEDNRDPELVGRVKVRVPHVFGPSGASGSIDTTDLPWAFPMGAPAGGTDASGGLSWLPEKGDQVYVQFLDGEPEKPVWSWGNQTRAQKDRLKLHQYDGQQVSRACLTRYGHTLEFRPDRVVLTTKDGYQLLVEGPNGPSGGQVSLNTPKGQSIALGDAGQSVVVQALETAVVSAKRVILNSATSTLVKATRFSVMVGDSLLTIQDSSVSLTTGSGASLLIDADGNVAITSASGSSLSLEGAEVKLATPTGTGLVLGPANVSINAPQMAINTTAMAVGTAARYPVLMLTPQALAWFLSHTHTNGNLGSPTGPPIPLDPTFPAASGSTSMRTT